jgi:diacylglycerol kinase (ATP)
MKKDTAVLKLLFIVNPGSGSNDTDFKTVITGFFEGQEHHFEIYELPDKCSKNWWQKL